MLLIPIYKNEYLKIKLGQNEVNFARTTSLHCIGYVSRPFSKKAAYKLNNFDYKIRPLLTDYVRQRAG